MVWFIVDDVLPFHERVIRAGNPAMGLWVRAGAWSAGQLTDGFVPGDVARTLGTPAEIRRLVDVGLWHPEERDGRKGYLFHAWAEDGTGTKRQPTRAEVEERRRAERERKAAWREARRVKSGGAAEDVPPGVPQGVPGGVPAGHPRVVPGGVPQGVPLYQANTKPIPIVEEHETADAVSSPTPADAAAGGERAGALELHEPDAPPPPKRAPYPDAFEFFWNRYPRREGKRAAFAAWQRACKRATAREIGEGAERYRTDPNREDEFTAHATTWLNRDGWADAPLPQRRPQAAQDRLAAAAGRMFDELGVPGMRGA